MLQVSLYWQLDGWLCPVPVAALTPIAAVAIFANPAGDRSSQLDCSAQCCIVCHSVVDDVLILLLLLLLLLGAVCRLRF